MKRLSLRLVVAAMCFAAGIGAEYLAWRSVDAIHVDEVPSPLAKVCGVHRTNMLIEPVPVEYKLGSILSIHHLYDRQRLFPNSNHFGIPKCRPADALIYYCPSCRIAQAKWAKRRGYWHPAEGGPCYSD